MVRYVLCYLIFYVVEWLVGCEEDGGSTDCGGSQSTPSLFSAKQRSNLAE
jgi:hypothetical protein